MYSTVRGYLLYQSYKFLDVISNIHKSDVANLFIDFFFHLYLSLSPPLPL